MPGYEESNKKKVAVFDIDETLIHNVKDKDDPYYKTTYTKHEGKSVKFKINIRPHVREALIDLNKDYYCIAFTVSINCYADTVLKEIDPENKIF